MQPLLFEKDGATTHSSDGDAVAAAPASNFPDTFRVFPLLSAKPAYPPLFQAGSAASVSLSLGAIRPS